MSNDVVSRLSAANPVPVPEDSADNPTARAALAGILAADQTDRVARGRWPGLVFGRRRTRLALSSVALAAVAALSVALSGGGNGGPSIIAQAYAATSSDGVILHYVVVRTILSSNTAPTSAAVIHSRTEVWQSGQRSHIFQTLAVRQRYGHESLTRNEVTENGSAIEYYIAGGAVVRRDPDPDNRCTESTPV